MTHHSTKFNWQLSFVPKYATLRFRAWETSCSPPPPDEARDAHAVPDPVISGGLGQLAAIGGCNVTGRANGVARPSNVPLSIPAVPYITSRLAPRHASRCYRAGTVANRISDGAIVVRESGGLASEGPRRCREVRPASRKSQPLARTHYPSPSSFLLALRDFHFVLPLNTRSICDTGDFLLSPPLS